jgi:hypothetical protein
MCSCYSASFSFFVTKFHFWKYNSHGLSGVLCNHSRTSCFIFRSCLDYSILVCRVQFSSISLFSWSDNLHTRYLIMYSCSITWPFITLLIHHQRFLCTDIFLISYAENILIFNRSHWQIADHFSLNLFPHTQNFYKSDNL